MHNKRKQIGDILFLIGETPEKVFLSNKQIPKPFFNIKELYDKKIEFTDHIDIYPYKELIFLIIKFYITQ